jgi:hypothetical protein
MIPQLGRGNTIRKEIGENGTIMLMGNTPFLTKKGSEPSLHENECTLVPPIRNILRARSMASLVNAAACSIA